MKRLILAILAAVALLALFSFASQNTLIAAVPTNTPRAVPPATNTPRIVTAAPQVLPTLTLVPSPTEPPTATPTRGRPTFTPQPTLIIMGTYETPVNTPATAIPPRAETPVPSGDDMVTILLLGSDTTERGRAGLTDVIIAVVVNRTRGTVSMLHFPRDLYVYAPNDTMRKLNTVFSFGNGKSGPGGGISLMKETLLYNFGLKVDFYARVGYTEFQGIIKALGGLKISVDCAIQGNRLKSPDLPIDDPESYEVYTLNIGQHTLDPYMALWYVRARGSSSDLDRGRRQLEVLRAIWRQARAAGLLTQVTTLWPEARKIIETDMTLSDIVGLAPIALSLEPVNIQRITVQQGVHLEQWYTSDTGSFAWLPNAAAWKTTIQNLMLPPPRTRLGGENPTVEIVAVPQYQGYDLTAADRLSWEGFTVSLPGPEGLVNRTVTVIYDYTGGAKPASLEALRKALRVPPDNIIDRPDPNARVDFRVEMGRDYGTSCFYGLPAE